MGAGFEGGHAFLASEYVAGPSLEEFVAEEGPWEGRDLLALAIGTATGLAAIHQAGLVHGDFGPEHVVLGAEGPRVVGFGITPPYGIATPAADMRAWAHTVLYAAAGGAADPEDPEDLDLLPEPLRTLAVRCMSADPGDQPSARSVVLDAPRRRPPARGGARRGVEAGGARLGAAVRRRPRPRTRRAGPGSAGPRPPGGWPGSPSASRRLSRSILFVQNQSEPLARRGEAARVDEPAGASSSASPATPLPTPAVKVPAALAGTWSGQVSQTNPTDVFQAQVYLASGANSGSVHYSGASFSCAGDLSPGVRLRRQA